MRRLVALVAAGACLSPSAILGQQSVHAPGLKTLQIELPLTERSICTAAFQWSVATGIPVGVECRWEVASQERVDDARTRRLLDLTGLRPDDSLKLVAEQLPGYVVSLKQGIAVFRQNRGAGLFVVLDQSVPDFVLTGASLQDAADDLYYRVSGVHRRPMRGPPGRASAPSAPPVSIEIHDATIETVLSAICRTYGQRLSWRVGYLSDERTATDSIIQFLSPSINVTAGPNMISRR